MSQGTNPIVEQRIRCPYCDETMDIVLDLSAGDQAYVEDCQICCQPIEIGFETDRGALIALRVDRAG